MEVFIIITTLITNVISILYIFVMSQTNLLLYWFKLLSM